MYQTIDFIYKTRSGHVASLPFYVANFPKCYQWFPKIVGLSMQHARDIADQMVVCGTVMTDAKAQMKRADAKVIICGLVPNGLDPHRLTAAGRQEVRAAIDKVLELCYDPDFDAGASPELRERELSNRTLLADRGKG